MPVFIRLLLGPLDNGSLHPSFSCLVQKGGTEQQEEAKNSNLSDELAPQNPFTLPLLASQWGPLQASSRLRASPAFCAAFPVHLHPQVKQSAALLVLTPCPQASVIFSPALWGP